MKRVPKQFCQNMCCTINYCKYEL